jgi:hypothetical protein
MVNFVSVCGCCTRTDIVRQHLEDTLRICDVSAMGLLTWPPVFTELLGRDWAIPNDCFKGWDGGIFQLVFEPVNWRPESAWLAAVSAMGWHMS